MSASVKLIAAGVAMLAAYSFLALSVWHSGARDVLTFLAVFTFLFLIYGLSARWVRHAGAGPAMLMIGVFAILFRLVLVFAGLPEDGRARGLANDLGSSPTGYSTFLLYDNDVWRYLWDGHQINQGVSPYRLAPEQVEGSEFERRLLVDDNAWDVYDRVYFPTHRTVYPPMAQYLFALSTRIAPGSVSVWKGLIATIDLLACLCLWRLLTVLAVDARIVLLYAWNPLVIKEFSGSGHVDALLVLLVVACAWALCRGRLRWGAVSFAAAVLAKVSPVVLAGVVWRRTGKSFAWAAFAFGVGAVPFLPSMPGLVDGLSGFARTWEFNAGPWALAQGLLAVVGIENSATLTSLGTGLLTLGLAAWLTLRDRGGPLALIHVFFVLLAVPVLLGPAVMPWYLCWALPFAVIVRFYPWIWLTGLSLLSYLIYIDGIERVWWRWLEFGGFVVALMMWQRSRSVRRAR